jgi:hypothetical protein
LSLHLEEYVPGRPFATGRAGEDRSLRR